MKIISAEELINHKILPYNIYSEFGEKLFAAGEVLTPGKILQLKHMSTLYRDEEVQVFAPEEEKQEKQEKQEVQVEKVDPVTTEKPKTVVEKFDMKPSSIVRNKFSVDDMDISNYRGPINKKAKIDAQTQIKIKAFYNQILEMLEDKPPLEMLGMFANVRDKIVQDIISDTGQIFLSSQLKLLGEYNKCHALNTAILGGALAKKMELNENLIYDVVLAGLIHDIGKSKISPELLTKVAPSYSEQKILQDHTRIGYKIIKEDMGLSENIAKVALDHHENNDGTGYPSGKSGERINPETQIIHVCNFFDNLTSCRTSYQVKNTKEALRVMLSLGTRHFAAKPLYTFIHMFSYNDTTNFEEMIL